MRTFDELQELWQASEAPPARSGSVVALTVRVGPLSNELREQVELSVELGVVGDRWSAGDEPNIDQQVSLMNARAAELVCHDDHPLSEPGDNLVVALDLSDDALPVGSRVRAGSALLEITPYPHKGCKKFRERFGADALRWVNHKDTIGHHFRGVYGKVIEPGVVRVGDAIVVED